MIEDVMMHMISGSVLAGGKVGLRMVMILVLQPEMGDATTMFRLYTSPGTKVFTHGYQS